LQCKPPNAAKSSISGSKESYVARGSYLTNWGKKRKGLKKGGEDWLLRSPRCKKLKSEKKREHKEGEEKREGTRKGMSIKEKRSCDQFKNFGSIKMLKLKKRGSNVGGGVGGG